MPNPLFYRPRSTGDQEVAGSIPAGSGDIYHLILSLKGSCQFLAKVCAQVLVARLEDY